MRVMAFDIGSARIGVAVSDSSGTVALPVSVVDTAKAKADGALIGRLLGDYEVEKILVGLPLSLDGQEGQQSQVVRMLASSLLGHRGLEIEYADERLSSVEAKRLLAEQGLTEREMRGKLDMHAACLFLQSYLDSGQSG